MQTAKSPDIRLKTIVDFFYQWEREQPDKVYLHQPMGNDFLEITWGEAGRQARRIAAYLQSLDLPAGSPIGLVSKNCAHWLIADIAIMLSGHVSVPFYPTLTAPQLRQVLTHSGCTVLFVGKIDNWSAMQPGVPDGVECVRFPGYESSEALTANPDHRQWNDLLATYPPMTGQPTPDPDAVSTIVYTSGTTGNPKGVMLTYAGGSELSLQTREQMFHDLPNTRFFSYLPLCHIAERNVVELMSLLTGGTIYFTDTLESFMRNLQEARPTHFIAVPRIWTKFQQGIFAKIPPIHLEAILNGDPVQAEAIKKQIRQSLGLDEAVVILTGAAPMPASLIQWYRRLGIIIQEAYGMTENFGAVSMMPADQIKDGTVGRINSGIEVKIAPGTGEILTRAPWNMKGYYNEPTLTKATLKDGWLYTGDVGEVDADGFLKLTGRVKDMYKSPKGEYIVPTRIEFGFAGNNHIEQVCITGQQLPQPVALIVLADVARQTDRALVQQSLEHTLVALNEQLHPHERVKKLIVVKDPWTVENNFITPTMKIKRNVIDAHYNPYVTAWYDRKEVVIWEE